jgi:hypothetical protein
MHVCSSMAHLSLSEALTPTPILHLFWDLRACRNLIQQATSEKKKRQLGGVRRSIRPISGEQRWVSAVTLPLPFHPKVLPALMSTFMFPDSIPLVGHSSINAPSGSPRVIGSFAATGLPTNVSAGRTTIGGFLSYVFAPPNEDSFASGLPPEDWGVMGTKLENEVFRTE